VIHDGHSTKIRQYIDAFVATSINNAIFLKFEFYPKLLTFQFIIALLNVKHRSLQTHTITSLMEYLHLHNVTVSKDTEQWFQNEKIKLKKKMQ
jgi:hypothetical protein